METYASEQGSQKRYTGRLPTLLGQSLVVECERSYKQSIRKMDKTSDEIERRNVFTGEMSYFCDKLDLSNASKLCPLIQGCGYWVFKAACEIGDTSTIQLPLPFYMDDIYVPIRLAITYHHWDVLDLILPETIPSSPYGAYLIFSSLISVPAIHYYEARYGPISLPPLTLRRSVVNICYGVGFDRELLDWVFQRAPIDGSETTDNLLAMVQFPGKPLHSTTLEVLKYVLEKHPHLKLRTEHYTMIVATQLPSTEIQDGLRKLLSG